VRASGVAVVASAAILDVDNVVELVAVGVAIFAVDNGVSAAPWSGAVGVGCGVRCLRANRAAVTASVTGTAAASVIFDAVDGVELVAVGVVVIFDAVDGVGVASGGIVDVEVFWHTSKPHCRPPALWVSVGFSNPECSMGGTGFPGGPGTGFPGGASAGTLQSAAAVASGLRASGVAVAVINVVELVDVASAAPWSGAVASQWYSEEVRPPSVRRRGRVAIHPPRSRSRSSCRILRVVSPQLWASNLSEGQQVSALPRKSTISRRSSRCAGVRAGAAFTSFSLRTIGDSWVRVDFGAVGRIA
jgi:hypothetical protein